MPAKQLTRKTCQRVKCAYLLFPQRCEWYDWFVSKDVCAQLNFSEKDCEKNKRKVASYENCWLTKLHPHYHHHHCQFGSFVMTATSSSLMKEFHFSRRFFLPTSTLTALSCLDFLFPWNLGLWNSWIHEAWSHSKLADHRKKWIYPVYRVECLCPRDEYMRFWHLCVEFG